MQILHFCLSRSFSGLEQYAMELAQTQSQTKDVGVIVTEKTRSEAVAQEKRIPHVSVNAYASFGLIRAWVKIFRFLRPYSKLKVIHFHHTQEVPYGLIPIRLLRLFGIRPKVVLQIHLWSSHKKKSLYHRLIYSVIDEVWCSSQSLKAELVKNFPKLPGQIKIVNYGRNIELMENAFLSRQEARQFLKLPMEAIVVGTVSRLEASKGIRDFVEALELKMTALPNLHGVVIGGPSENDSEAIKYSEDLKTWLAQQPQDIQNRLHLVGALDKAFRYLKAFDLYVLPSYLETFSLALLDAQLAGLPVIGSASGGTPDVVLPQKTGWLFSPRNQESLKTLLTDALNQTELWPEMGNRARERVRKDFDQKVVFKQILENYSLES